MDKDIELLMKMQELKSQFTEFAVPYKKLLLPDLFCCQIMILCDLILLNYFTESEAQEYVNMSFNIAKEKTKQRKEREKGEKQ